MALQALAEFTKQPGEDFPIAIEFANRLPSGASLVSGTATGRNANTLEVDNTILLSQVVTVDGTLAKVRIKAGANGTQYKITFVVTLTDASILEEDLLMNVMDR